jgi:hypothetical protein
MGNYFAEFTLDANYVWADGTDGVLILYWVIAMTQGSAAVIIEDFTYTGSYHGAPGLAFIEGDWEKWVLEYSSNGVNWSTVAPANAGTYWIRAVLTESEYGDYADLTTAPKQYTISPKVLTNELLDVVGDFVFNHLPHTPDANVSGLLLTDYDVSYQNNVDAGNATLMITGKGNYTGSLSVNFTISPMQITEDMFNALADVTYNGSERTPQVTASGTEPEVTFSVAYRDNKFAGTATVTVSGTGNYGGDVGLTFVINKAVPVFTVPSGLTAVYGQTLTDIALPATGWEWDWNFYDRNAATVGNAGVNHFWGVFTPADSDNFDRVLRLLDVTVSRAPVAQPAAVTGLQWTGAEQNGIIYVPGSTAYGIESGVTGAAAVGSYTVTFTLNPNYMWQGGSTAPLTLPWEIAQKPLSDELLPVSGSFVYNGGLHTPEANVSGGLIEGIDYEVSYSNNTLAGDNAVLTITGIGNYTGTLSVNFTISPEAVDDDVTSDGAGIRVSYEWPWFFLGFVIGIAIALVVWHRWHKDREEM